MEGLILKDTFNFPTRKFVLRTTTIYIKEKSEIRKLFHLTHLLCTIMHIKARTKILTPC